MRYTLYIIFVFVCNVAIFIALAGMANAETLSFSWDYPQDAQIDGFNLYSGPMGQDEDGTWAPQYADLPLFAGIPAIARTFTANEIGWPDQAKKFCFMLRAFRGDEESADSNIVCKVIDNTELSPPEITSGEYKDGSVSLAWNADDVRAVYFRIFYRVDDGTDFVEAGRVDRPEAMPARIDAPIDAVAAGESKTLHFVVVGYKTDGIYSDNSAELSILIDRREEGTPLPAPTDFNFSAVIPLY